MGFIHIPNLYKDKTILELFKQCYWSEKIEGSTASISWDYMNKTTKLDSGPTTGTVFLRTLPEDIGERIAKMFPASNVELIGEIYGTKNYLPKKSAKYGVELGWVMFKAIVNDCWTSMDDSYDIATKLGLEFVPFGIVEAEIGILDKLRDEPSLFAQIKGLEGVQREGIVIEPIIPLRMNTGDIVIAKHKGKEESETATVREVSNDKLKVLADAQAIADEWVTPNRLEHVMSKVPNSHINGSRHLVIQAMADDVYREGTGEIVESREATSAIMKKTAELLRKLNEDTSRN